MPQRAWPGKGQDSKAPALALRISGDIDKG
jgi:hypothetical protein